MIQPVKISGLEHDCPQFITILNPPSPSANSSPSQVFSDIILPPGRKPSSSSSSTWQPMHRCLGYPADLHSHHTIHLPDPSCLDIEFSIQFPELMIYPHFLVTTLIYWSIYLGQTLRSQRCNLSSSSATEVQINQNHTSRWTSPLLYRVPALYDITHFWI